MSEERIPVVFETEHRVKFREVDPYGHMNMAHYLTYFTDHRFEGMRRFIDLSLTEIQALPIAFFTRSVTIEYLLPLFADQEFMIQSQLAELKRSQCIVDFKMIDDQKRVAATAVMRVGCIVRATGRPGAWPEGLMERFYR